MGITRELNKESLIYSYTIYYYYKFYPKLHVSSMSPPLSYASPLVQKITSLW